MSDKKQIKSDLERYVFADRILAFFDGHVGTGKPVGDYATPLMRDWGVLAPKSLSSDSVASRETLIQALQFPSDQRWVPADPAQDERWALAAAGRLQKAGFRAFIKKVDPETPHGQVLVNIRTFLLNRAKAENSGKIAVDVALFLVAHIDAHSIYVKSDVLLPTLAEKVGLLYAAVLRADTTPLQHHGALNMLGQTLSTIAHEDLMTTPPRG